VPQMPYARLEELNQLLQKMRRGEVKPRPSLSGLVPQRRVVWGGVDVSMPCFGVKGLLVPYLFGGLLVVLLALVAAILGSWILSILILVGGAILVGLAYRRM
jgi:hypothetical protein